MRIVTFDSRMLQQSTLDKINSVPYFGSDKDEGGGFLSNKYSFENNICILEELCYPRDYREQVLPIKLKQLSNLVAIYKLSSEMYWVIKNRYIGRHGWHTREEFTELVMKEINPVKSWNSLDTTSTNQ